jgi:hypothetical protein
MRPILRFGTWAAAAGLLVVLLAAIATSVKLRREIDRVSDEQKLARSLEIIRTSSASDRKVLKVLFYGQSITLSGWHNAVVDHWRQAYPNTVFVVENRALGGFASPALERTTEEDIAAFYPDLIIFHVYGDHHAYERIIRMFRSRTAADIIVQTDYGNTLPEPPCDEGLHLSLHRPPGCAGFIWLHQREWYDGMSYHKIPSFAAKYQLAVEPQRTWWRDYLIRNHVEASSMVLPDHTHPNAQGKALMAALFDRYFDHLVESWNGQTEHNVLSISPAAVATQDGQETIQFDGSRLEMLTSKPIAAWPSVSIDGRSPEQVDGCYFVTRASPTQTVPTWPAVRRVSLASEPTSEDWTATINNMTPDQKTFDFSVRGSVTGDDGGGSSAHDFVSKSGKLSIAADDWMFARAFELSHTPTHTPFDVRWSVDSVCGNHPEVIDEGDGAMQYRYVLGAGLTNADHTVKLSLGAADVTNVTEFRAYKPPLQQN